MREEISRLEAGLLELTTAHADRAAVWESVAMLEGDRVATMCVLSLRTCGVSL